MTAQEIKTKLIELGVADYSITEVEGGLSLSDDSPMPPKKAIAFIRTLEIETTDKGTFVAC